ncbi:microtubule-associated tumor suppressor 1 homolog isoform X2 [Xyrauchen texanus]|uniref:microtubule-associated tumor suppressor 1 homolog isoform X2 n=1 Tax=Xyrauchen texanus TaxID=154827 RepID=UPI002242994F|nr:microtubule-associated tumor suppressor 1 homolog isoform X2 [Xyrauchen texanus]
MEPPVDKSELPNPTLPKITSQGSQHGMCLPLHSGVQSNSAFTSESSLSSSSAMPPYDRGEASPDSMCSLSSLSSARTYSPLDVDMPEVEMGKTIINSDDSVMQSPNCRPDYSESIDNDNSVSVYLDANEDCWSDNDNHDGTLMVTQKVGLNDNSDEASLCSSEHGDYNDLKKEEKEDSFLSLVSVDLVLKSQIGVSALEVSTSSEVDLLKNTLPDLSQDQPAEGKSQSSNRVTDLATVNAPQREVVQEKGELSVELCPDTQANEIILNEMVVHLEDSVGNRICTRNIKVLSVSKEDNQPKSTVKKTNALGGHGLTKPPKRAALTKATKPEVKRFPRPDLKNVKAKIISRAASAPRSASPAKTISNLGQSASANVKMLPLTANRETSRRVEDKAVGKRSRSSSSHAREPKRSDCRESDPKLQTTCLPPDRKKALIIESSVNHTEVAEVDTNGNQEKVVITLSLQTRGEVFSPSTDLIDEEKVQLMKETEEEPSKGTSKTVSSKLGPSLGTTASSTSTSGPPEPRLKPPSREARPTGSLGPSGGRAVQPSGILRMRTTDKLTGPYTPTTFSSSPGKGAQRAPSSKLPVKGLPTSPSSSSLGSTISESNGIAVNKVPAELKNEEKPIKQSPSSHMQGKSPVSKPVSGHRSRASSIPSKPVAGLKAPTMTNHMSAKTNQNVLQRTGSARLIRSATTVDKSSKGPKAAGTTAGLTQQHSSTGGTGQTEEEEERDLRLQNEKKSQCILQLRKLIANGNQRLEALALVVQHVFSEREVALSQREELSIQLNKLRQQLGNSVSCCEQLEREKEEVRVSLEALLQKLQEQHQTELEELEERLKEFYSAEWDKTHQAYQKEADKCRALMQQQVEEVRNQQEALRNQREVAHTERIEILKREYENSYAELRKIHNQDMQELDKTLKESEASLNEKIQSLTAENETLKERLREEEEWRKALAEKSQKDAHTLYLEQELESLRAVLEIKTNQIHQQDKKLMQMDKLIDDNLKLEEYLNKVQQENEDYKARMDKHAALSKQLSTEQAMLQQTLQKESKVNKRLSMENEELLWKLHNGDLCSPRHLSPTSPFHPPQNSASFSTTPISPR